MMFTQVVLFASVVMGATFAVVYGAAGSGPSGAGFPSFGGGGSYGSGPSSAGTGFPSYGGGAGRRQGQNEAPKPYNFRYDVDDVQGNIHYRNEESDQNGRVRGSYGYFNAQGLYRKVEYTADENGFRANIETNEPGVDGKESPADVRMNAQQPPAGIYESGPFRGYGGSRGGFSSGGASGAGGQGGYGGGAGAGGASGGSGGYGGAGGRPNPGTPGMADLPH